MTASLNPYFDKYQQACKAYVQKDYEQAVALIDEVVENLPDDPNTHLLRGHIYYVLSKYDIAKTEYHSVLDLTDNLEVISCAKEGLDNISKSEDISEDISGANFTNNDYTNDSDILINLDSSLENSDESELNNTEATGEFGDSGFNLNTWSELSTTQGEIKNPFEVSTNNTELNSTPNSNDNFSNDNFIDPFSVTPETTESSNL